MIHNQWPQNSLNANSEVNTKNRAFSASLPYWTHYYKFWLWIGKQQCIIIHNLFCILHFQNSYIIIYLKVIESTCRWSKSLPGVATRIFTPVASFWDSTCLLAPPITKPWVCEWYFKSSFRTPNVCIDSSRVGEMTITPVPFLGENLSLYMRSTAGMRNASVFPLPVFAETTASLVGGGGGEKKQRLKFETSVCPCNNQNYLLFVRCFLIANWIVSGEFNII